MFDHLTTSVRIIQLQPFLDNYCMHDKQHMKCVRYEYIEHGTEPPSDLLPDGSSLKA